MFTYICTYTHKYDFRNYMSPEAQHEALSAICIYMYVYMYTYTYMYTYIYTYT